MPSSAEILLEKLQKIDDSKKSAKKSMLDPFGTAIEKQIFRNSVIEWNKQNVLLTNIKNLIQFNRIQTKKKLKKKSVDQYFIF